jgi:hypothetical protein
MDYVYQPLDPNQQEFRILVLLPSEDFNDGIECDLEHHSLTSNPIYYAVSHTRAGEEPTEPIHLHGKLFQVTPNLFTGLKQIRCRRKELTL